VRNGSTAREESFTRERGKGARLTDSGCNTFIEASVLLGVTIGDTKPLKAHN
jgi:hypothetical protein